MRIGGVPNSVISRFKVGGDSPRRWKARRAGSSAVRLRNLAPLLVFIAALLISGCGASEEARQVSPEVAERRAARGEKTLTLLYPDWSSEIASAHLLQAVLQERLGYRVDLIPVSVEEMWSRVAAGEADLLAGAWLPTTHRGYFEEYGEKLIDLGPHLTGARIGLAVPTVMPGRQTGDDGRQGRRLVTIETIPELADRAEEFRGRIVGIESGSGVVTQAKEALDAYGLTGTYYVMEGDEEEMLSRLARATHRGEWIVFTGWRPHYVFELYNIRFLEDPRGVFGGEESVHTMVRSGFEESYPDAYRALSRIAYEPEQLERLMLWIEEDEESDPYLQALRWLEAYSELVDAWVEGIE